MQTDPISAAHGYVQALKRILKATTLHEARKVASAALDITFTPAEGGNISIHSSAGKRPFVTLGIANPTESANPIVQMSSDQAREIALQILEAADASESDGFIAAFAQQQLGASQEQAAALLQEFRRYRERLRGKEEEE